MHDTVMRFLVDQIMQSDIQGKSVLEVGSQNINGTPRTVVSPLKPSSYTGVDFASGAGVDVVGDASDLVTLFGRDRFDVVISTEMLEHAKDWKKAVHSMKAVLKPGGLLIVTTRGPGFGYHGFPHDYWRFTVDDFSRIFDDFKQLVLIPDPVPGVLFKGVKPDLFRENDLSNVEVQPAPPAP